jgi:hypothetical protein
MHLESSNLIVSLRGVLCRSNLPALPGHEIAAAKYAAPQKPLLAMTVEK